MTCGGHLGSHIENMEHAYIYDHLPKSYKTTIYTKY